LPQSNVQARLNYPRKAIKQHTRGEQAGLELTDSLTDFIIKLAAGNPGALTALVQVCDHEEIEKIDPDNSILGSLAYLLNLDSYGIYQEKIWMLYNDVCEENMLYFVGMLRALQLGLIDPNKVYYAIENRGACLDIEQVLSDVQKRLPRFGLSIESEKSEENESTPSWQWIESILEKLYSYFYSQEHEEL